VLSRLARTYFHSLRTWTTTSEALAAVQLRTGNIAAIALLPSAGQSYMPGCSQRESHPCCRGNSVSCSSKRVIAAAALFCSRPAATERPAKPPPTIAILGVQRHQHPTAFRRGAVPRSSCGRSHLFRRVVGPRRYRIQQRHASDQMAD
jgi:hypothetical protein